MSPGLRLAVLGPDGAQERVRVAAAVAWEGAERGRVLLVDADPCVGTVADVLGLDPAQRLSAVWGPTGVSAAALRSVATPMPGRAGLDVVAGFERPIAEWPAVLAGLAPALAERDLADLVVVHLGSPFAAAAGAPALDAALGMLFDAVVLVLRSDADLLARSVRLLWGTPLPRARVVLIRPPKERGPAAAGVLRAQLPWLPEPLEWRMDRRRVEAAMLAHRPVLRPGGLLQPLGLGGGVRVAPATRRRGRFRRGAAPVEDGA